MNKEIVDTAVNEIAPQAMAYGFKITAGGTFVFTWGALGDINIMTMLGGMGLVIGLFIQRIGFIYKTREHKAKIAADARQKIIDELTIAADARQKMIDELTIAKLEAENKG